MWVALQDTVQCAQRAIRLRSVVLDDIPGEARRDQALIRLPHLGRDVLRDLKVPLRRRVPAKASCVVRAEARQQNGSVVGESGVHSLMRCRSPTMMFVTTSRVMCSSGYASKLISGDEIAIDGLPPQPNSQIQRVPAATATVRDRPVWRPDPRAIAGAPARKSAHLYFDRRGPIVD